MTATTPQLVTGDRTAVRHGSIRPTGHGADPSIRPGTRLTVGVEEEFLLIDPATGHNVPIAEHVVSDLSAEARAQSRLEFAAAWSRW